MFPGVDAGTKDMLLSSGELQRAYLVTLSFNEAYDAYVDKHKDRFVEGVDLHRAAEDFALTVIGLVFGQDRA